MTSTSFPRAGEVRLENEIQALGPGQSRQGFLQGLPELEDDVTVDGLHWTGVLG